jgi:prevent-host-death family protein
MKFIPSRDLRLKTASVLNDLKKDGEIIITSNGKPSSLMISIDESNLEQTLSFIKSMKAKTALRNIRLTLRNNKISSDDIDKEIKAVRKENP